MRNCRIQIGLVLLATLLLSSHVHAQLSATDEARIITLRSNIQRLVENAPPVSAPDDNFQRTLRSLRGELVRLLLRKSGDLEGRINRLEEPGALPETLAIASEWRGKLKAINDEISSLDQALGGPLPLGPPATPAPLSAPTPAPTPATVPRERAVFETALASITPADLAAAVPENVPESSVSLCRVDGQPAGDKPSMYDRSVCALARDVLSENRTILLEADQANVLTILIAKLLTAKADEPESYAAFVTEAQERRIDQQVGAGPTSNASTSIVAKGGIPFLLGFAVENGAATQVEKDTSITFRLNPGGLINLFADRGFITAARANEDDPFMKFLGKTSVGLTFDTTRGDTPGVFTGRGQQLSEISARVEFFNDRDPRQKKYAAQWENLVATAGNKLANQSWKTTKILIDWNEKGVKNAPMTFRDPTLQVWLNQINDTLRNVDPALTGAERINAVAETINEQAANVPVALIPEDVVAALTDFASELKSYTDAKNEILDKIAKGRIFTLEYTNHREVNVSDTSNFNFIFSTGTGRRVDLTTNGSFTFFHTRPAPLSPAVAQPGRLRDFQFAGQIDVPFRVGEGQFDLWFSGRYTRLMEDATLSNGLTIPNTKGDIAVGQLGLQVPIKGLGVKFPISVTFANRTELVKEKVVRGNFGFTFNWDTLLSKLKPF